MVKSKGESGFLCRVETERKPACPFLPCIGPWVCRRPQLRYWSQNSNRVNLDLAENPKTKLSGMRTDKIYLEGQNFSYPVSSQTGLDYNLELRLWEKNNNTQA